MELFSRFHPRLPACKMIILCQPKPNTGCSACCGLFNLKDISRENLTRILSEWRLNRDENKIHPTQKFIGDARDDTSHICPYQGFLSRSTPGCLMHKTFAGRDMRGLSLFGEKICSEFLCPAHLLLDESLKRFLIDTIEDWYLYSTAIIDPLSFAWIYSRCEEIFSRRHKPDDITAMINNCMTIHAARLNSYGETVFSYSVSEYNLNKDKFSLSGTSAFSMNSKKIILESLEHTLIELSG